MNVPGTKPYPDWTASAGVTNGGFGCSAAVGDFNGDGIKDVAIGARELQPSGGVFLFYGTLDGISTNGVLFPSIFQQRAMFGASLAAMPDVNGDGYDELLVGAPNGALNGVTNHYYLGWVGMFPGSKAGLGRIPVWEIEGMMEGAQLGQGIVVAGDVNGDGYRDLLVSMPYARPEAYEQGVVRLYPGVKGGFSKEFLWERRGDNVDGRLGESITDAGDINGDGLGDVAGASPFVSETERQIGRVFLFPGSRRKPSGDPASWSDSPTRRRSRAGSSISGGWDIDGDGYSDLAVGIPGTGAKDCPEALVTLFLGSKDGLSASRRIEIPGTMGSRFGQRVAMLKDINGDGLADLAVTALSQSTWFRNSGRVYIYLGNRTNFSTQAVCEFDSGLSGAWIGSELIDAGDVNGDGLSDLLIAWRADATRASALGRVDLILGSRERFKNPTYWVAASRDGYVPFDKDDKSKALQAIASVSPPKVPRTTNVPIAQSRPVPESPGPRPSEGQSNQALLATGSLFVAVFGGFAWFWVARQKRVLAVAERQRKESEEERRRLAENLHDVVGGALTRMALNEPAEGNEKAKKGFNLLDDEIWLAKPENDSVQSMASYFADKVTGYLGPVSISVVLDLPEPGTEDRFVSRTVRRELLFVLGEILANAAKHSRATKVSFALRILSSGLLMQITDNGSGFDRDRVVAGDGLGNIRRRAERLGGEHRCRAAEGKGTEHKLVIPWKQS